MQGLELSRLYYRELCAPMLERDFPDLARRVACGLAGEGSECLGFDDEISRDHDWGAGLCLWLSGQDYASRGADLQAALARLPESVAGFPAREPSPRTGVLEIGEFYFRHIGHDGIPESLADWLAVSEESLAAVTSGIVFADPLGEFTRIRQGLLAFYPEDARRKKLAARCLTMAQAGQYNLFRCLKRKEYVAAAQAEAAFVAAACSAVFLLHKRYKPFYKWMHRALADLPAPGPQVRERLSVLVGERAYARKETVVEDICALVACELQRQGLSNVTDSFLVPHGVAVQKGICDAGLRAMNVLAG